MIEAFRYNVTLRAFLDCIVADLRCCNQSFLQISCFEPALTGDVMPPDSGETICLEFNLDRHLVCLNFTHGTAHLVKLRQYPNHILDMVTHFVRKHIGLGKIATGTKFLLKLTVK